MFRKTKRIMETLSMKALKVAKGENFVLLKFSMLLAVKEPSIPFKSMLMRLEGKNVYSSFMTSPIIIGI